MLQYKPGSDSYESIHIISTEAYLKLANFLMVTDIHTLIQTL